MPICPRCKKEKLVFVRGYCNYCYTTLHRRGDLPSLVKIESPSKLTKLQHSVIIGGLLGDSCLFIQTKNSRPFLQITRSLQDKKYLYWQYEVFKDFCNNKPIPTKKIIDLSEDISSFSNIVNYPKKFHIEVIGDKKIYHGLHLSSRVSSAFIPYYDKWYGGESKHLPANLALDKLAIAVWFCDDGSVTTTSSKFRFLIEFATQSFTKNENEFLADLLTRRYNCNFAVKKDGTNFSIWSADAGARALLNEIDDIIPIGMERKTKKWRNASARFYKDIPIQYFGKGIKIL